MSIQVKSLLQTKKKQWSPSPCWLQSFTGEQPDSETHSPPIWRGATRPTGQTRNAVFPISRPNWSLFLLPPSRGPQRRRSHLFFDSQRQIYFQGPTSRVCGFPGFSWKYPFWGPRPRSAQGRRREERHKNHWRYRRLCQKFTCHPENDKSTFHQMQRIQCEAPSNQIPV